MILYHNRGPVLNFIPPQEDPPVEYESLLLPPERPKKTRSRESRRRRRAEAENQSPEKGDVMEQYHQHRKERCECCYKFSIFAEQGRIEAFIDFCSIGSRHEEDI